MIHIVDSSPFLKNLVSECEPNWTTLRKAVEDEEKSISGEWGSMTIPAINVPDRKNIVRKHEVEKVVDKLTDKGWASTTPKIVTNALQSINKLKGFDETIKR